MNNLNSDSLTIYINCESDWKENLFKPDFPLSTVSELVVRDSARSKNLMSLPETIGNLSNLKSPSVKLWNLKSLPEAIGK